MEASGISKVFAGEDEASGEPAVCEGSVAEMDLAGDVCGLDSLAFASGSD